jgi:hypothetical protein
VNKSILLIFLYFSEYFHNINRVNILSIVVTIFTTCSIIHCLCTLPAECIYDFLMNLIIICDYLSKHRRLTPLSLWEQKTATPPPSCLNLLLFSVNNRRDFTFIIQFSCCRLLFMFRIRIIFKTAKLSRYMPWRHMGERRYSSYSYLTSALDGGEWSASRPGRALPPGKESRYSLYRWLGGPQSRSGSRG